MPYASGQPLYLIGHFILLTGEIGLHITTGLAKYGQEIETISSISFIVLHIGQTVIN